MSVESIYEEARWRADLVEEGISVTVLTPNRDVAIAVAPDLARILHPDRRFGPVLYAEPVDDRFEVVVRDLGPRYVMTQGISPEGRAR